MNGNAYRHDISTVLNNMISNMDKYGRSEGRGIRFLSDSR